MARSDISEVAATWQDYASTLTDWESLVRGITPKEGGCGLVYELPNPLDHRPEESFAIADMRGISRSEPHKHGGGETEIYCVLQGVGRIAVGNSIQELSPGTTIVTPPDTMHCVLPGKGLVLAVINTPPFSADNYIPVNPTDSAIAPIMAQLEA
jgi:mannose-6-phosphate isomerase-like protein (cupin superfamily)